LAGYPGDWPISGLNKMNMLLQTQARAQENLAFTPASTGLIQRKCACGGTPGLTGECEECRKKKLQRKTQNSGFGSRNDVSVPPIVHEVLRSPGQLLDPATRAFMEPRFGHDFTKVRVHTDGRAAESARSVSALAYTVGSHVVFAPGQYQPVTATGQRLLAHELAHVAQQSTRLREAGAAQGMPGILGVGDSRDPAEREADALADLVLSQKAAEEHMEMRLQGNPIETPKLRKKDGPAGAKGQTKTAPEPPKEGTEPKPTVTGPLQRLYVVRDKRLQLGGEFVKDLDDFKHKVMTTKTEADWTLVLSIHGSEERLGAQSPPDWQKDAIFYQAPDIQKLFNNDRDFVKWRDQYGPTYLSLVSCQVSASFEGTLIANLTRAGAGGKRQPGRGLGAGCKPIATTQQFTTAKTRLEFDKLRAAEREKIIEKLKDLNNRWGYYGAPPVPDDQVLHYYFDEEPKGEWVLVEVMVGTGHDVADLKSTGIPFWNRTTGPKAAEFRKLCSQGVGELKREHAPAVPTVGD
jgi:hypothetical protein